MKLLKDIGEFGLIKRIAKAEKISDKDVIAGIGDDAAVLKYKKNLYLLLTTDILIEDVHFNQKATPFQIGWKALAVNISDIAAMGGIPRYALVSLGLRKEIPIKFVDEIYQGIRTLAKKFDVQILGGDTVSSSKIVINIALTGEVEKSCLTLRKGAKIGDKIYVTGRLGGSITGKHLSFIPRVKEARYLLKEQEFKGADEHFEKAVRALNVRPNPDVENCVKDAVAAIESVGRIIVNDEKALLPDIIKDMTKKGIIPKPLDQAIQKVYEYRGSEPGVAHGAVQASKVTVDEAEFVLAMSAAMIIYLVKKRSKV